MRHQNTLPPPQKKGNKKEKTIAFIFPHIHKVTKFSLISFILLEELF